MNEVKGKQAMKCLSSRRCAIATRCLHSTAKILPPKPMGYRMLEGTTLKMKKQCEKCGTATGQTDVAYICSFECTFCKACTELQPTLLPSQSRGLERFVVGQGRG